ncbi:MAG: hypothetical protein GC191_10900 [Azospirillum sp.]|nr:hypothetical protein [Azospirillum sp.]
MTTIGTDPTPYDRGAGDLDQAAWRTLTFELDSWATSGQTVSFWWRDDDASDVVPPLQRLRALADRTGVPVALAVIPASATPGLADFVGGWPGATVLQHGWDHVNRAAGGAKKTELAAGRPVDKMLADIEKGAKVIATLFGERSLPVLVPPWNRVAPAVVSVLPKLGISGLSAFKGSNIATGGLVEVNTHIDIINWQLGGFTGARRALEDTVSQLRARRLSNTAAKNEPTGLLTHHLVHDEASWAFLERFLALTAGHPAVRWLDAAAVFKRAS